jgi:3',5'-cyclic-AMP phosphodiesterase
MPPEHNFIEADFINVVQLTDSHLFADADARLLGLDTCASLDAVIDLVLEEQPRIDLVLATGDITQDGSELSYQRFMSSVARLPAPCRWLPGNHDDAQLMKRLGESVGFNMPCFDIGAWRLVMLDSSVAGSVAGWLAPEQLAMLDAALEDESRQVLVCLHHHPVPIGVAWMDPLGLLNASDLLDRLAGRPSVRGVLWGHVHQTIDTWLGTLRMLATPSTCIQFAPRVEQFSTDDLQPGYRWLRLYADGRLDTGVSRLTGDRFVADRDATGY